VSLGAQDLSIELGGSFTGSVSGAMLKNCGAKYVIVGHSERRREGDTDGIVGKKAFTAISTGLIPIICIGEESRDPEGLFLKHVADSVRNIFANIPENLLSKIIIAYEPVWAVGKSYDTVLSTVQIHEMIIFIQKTLAEMFEKKNVMSIPIIYGGSVDLENAKTILGDGEVRGLLIGRKSIEAGFSDIISYAGQTR
jgi:triosephosphate isomerase